MIRGSHLAAPAVEDTARDTELREILLQRRRELQDDVQRRMRDGRDHRPTDVRDQGEHSDANTFEDLQFALLQLKAETLSRIEMALKRLNAGQYGQCFECDAEISAQRLRALPFAVRCKQCEDGREQAQARAWRLDHQGPSSLQLFHP